MDSKKTGSLHFSSLPGMQTKETKASSCLLKFQELELHSSTAERRFESFLVCISPAPKQLHFQLVIINSNGLTTNSSH